MPDTPLVATARVPLADPLGMAEQLCRHFVEHGTVVRTATGGRIESSFGRAELHAEDGHLHLRAEARDATALYVVKNALAEHIALFTEAAPSFAWSGGEVLAIPFFRAMAVVGARQVTPHMRRVTLAGGDVGHFDNGAGLHVRLLIPPAGRSPVWPTPAPDGRTLWPSGEDELVRRVYTVRAIDKAAGTIDIDMVLHDDDGVHSAPGSTWAATARAGDPVGVMGPGGGMPPEADWHVLAGDETALPAIARIIEGLPAGRQVHAFIEVADKAEEQPLAGRAALSIRWLHREGTKPGTTDVLERALRAMEWPREGRGHVMVGCEHAAAKAIRALLRAERGMNPRDAHIAAYWRRGRGGDDPGRRDDE
ncbi:siderophore-interacting protein [Ancylobacter sp. VNQ12]|uniref:siderophore-interacting protein n=1 Tax=Ancylobacter sp. VNQ12 TaxID=3400920 RepID=UPI003C0D010B